MELALLRDKRISLFGHGTFQRYVFMLSTRFVRISGNGFNCFQNMEPPSLRSTSRGGLNSRVYDERACDTMIVFLRLETEESISEIDSHHILQEACELSDRVIKQGPGNFCSQARW